MTIPIILFTYNRPGHLKKCLNSIQKIKKIKKIYFFCDGPIKNADEIDLKKIKNCRSIIKNVNWVDKEIYIQEKNIGIKKTLLLSANVIFDQNNYEFAIYLEDDNIILPSFYEYMKTCSKKFLNNKRIFSVSGYNFLLNKKLYSQIKEDFFFSNYTNTWSIGFWKRSWRLWNKEILNLEGKANAHIFKDILNSKNYILYDSLLEGYIKKNNAGSTYFYTSWKYGKLTVFPKYPLIKNIGMDGTGENCILTDKYENQQRFPLNYRLRISKKIAKPNKNIEIFLNTNLMISKKKIFFFKICPFIFQIPILKIYYNILKFNNNKNN